MSTNPVRSLEAPAAPPAAADGEPAVVVNNLSKVYRLYAGAWPRVIEALTFGRKCMHVPHWALRGVSFSVPQGATLGIVGSNGAGKSTLLKILTGTTQATAGTYAVRGKVSSLLELGAGFNLEFSGRDNIYMNASILGFSRKQTHGIYQKIVEFSELGPYIEHPLRTYSSGMIMRLGFSIAINVDPEVLILDEVFAVGDAHFQKKCIDHITRFREQDKTILFVSHAIAQVREICDEVLWIRDGRPQMLGEPVMVTQEYENYERERALELRRRYETTMFEHFGKREGPKLRGVRLKRPGSDEPVDRLRYLDPIEVHLDYETFAPDQVLHLVVCILRNDGLLVAVGSTKHESVEVPHTGKAIYRVPAQPLLAAAYAVSAYIFDDSGLLIYDQILEAARFHVDPTDWDLGLIRLDGSWEFPRG
ncbi:MAG: ABC transporter ATP-binding protein [Planctomycetes bacterium]|nr:ABC transporter ATP-binding protein [Planctomycetota bacterium]